MANFNKVMLMGNLTRDPELRYTQNNTPVASISLAVNRSWFNKQTNERQEETTFVDCDAWARTAEVMSQYLSKGRPVFIEGRLRLDQWQDRDGGNRSKLKVVIENFQFIDSGGGGAGGGGGAPGGAQRSQPAQYSAPTTGTAPAPSAAPAAPPPADPGDPTADIDSDDIPF